jgi:O2-independent ubiquinone biosynthesis accessory factor UbiT
MRREGGPDIICPAGSRPALKTTGPRLPANTLFFSRRLVMEGDTELGLQVKNTLDAIDLEEGLSLLPPLPAGLVRTWLPRAAG